jgi:signal transduction histidine kinase
MSGAVEVAVRLTELDHDLVMEADVPTESNLDMTVVLDRVDAAGGTLSVARSHHGTQVKARFPAARSTDAVDSTTSLVAEPS